MKNFIFKKPFTFCNFALRNLPLASCLLPFTLCLLLFSSCNTEGVKLNGNDRIAIDTLSANAIKNLTFELDKRCKDSADVLRKQLVDSLVIVREREIIMTTQPPNH
jgi:hypothetical protein